MERIAGIEPASIAWKAIVLPLNYIRIWCPNLDSNGEPIAYKAIALAVVLFGHILAAILYFQGQVFAFPSRPLSLT